MESISPQTVLEMIGESNLAWIAGEFNQSTILRDVPEDILDRISNADITKRDYSQDPDGMTSIAFLTFAYKMAGMVQEPKNGPRDILFLKVLGKNEKARRKGKSLSDNPMWNAPLFELITGEVGERIRDMNIL